MVFEIQKNVPLAELTTFKIGGKARFFARAKNETEVIKSLEFAEENNLEIFILGGGSNILVADEGFEGLVLQISLKGITTAQNIDGKIEITAQAGEDWDDLVAYCVERNLAGIECLSGIPGFVGGTPVQNVGAYGQEVSETVKLVRVFDRQTKLIKELSNADCGFAYRASIFNSIKPNRFIVLSVTYELTPGGQPKITYADLKNYFSNTQPDLKQVRTAVCEIRASKGMLVRQNGADGRSAGSFFKNPIVGSEKFAELKSKAQKLNIENVPFYQVDEKTIKIPAAWLIEKAGFTKGFVKGNVGLSAKHSLALINRGGAAAREILELMAEIQKKVKENFALELKPEPSFIGFDNKFTVSS